MRHFMLLPALSCPARCGYCFGPHAPLTNGMTEIMGQSMLSAAADWIRRAAGGDEIEITFHGGEPLLAGAGFFRRALCAFSEVGGGDRPIFGLQSNLWLLDDELCDLFRQEQVSLGTSLDGPEEINDAQRGRGYFRRTMAGIELARQRGLAVGVIATLTAQSARRWREVLSFFQNEGLDVSFHAALPRLGQMRGTEDWVLSPAAFAQVLEEMASEIGQNGSAGKRWVRLEPVVSACQSLHRGGGGSCVFGECLGKFLAISPDGGIYPCQRFAGLERFRLGNVLDVDSPAAMAHSPGWGVLEHREAQINTACAGCDFLDICHGGCPYNALAAGGEGVDPYCDAYRRLFKALVERAADEFFAAENLNLIVDQPAPEGQLLRKGALLDLMAGWR